MLKLMPDWSIAVSACLLAATRVFTAESAAGLQPLQGKWSVTKTNRENQRYSQLLEIKNDQFTFQIIGDDDRVRRVAKGTVQVEKSGAFEVLKTTAIQSGRSLDELAPAADRRSSVYTLREGKLIIASNFDKEHENEPPAIDSYVHLETPKEDKLLGNWKVAVSMADQKIDYGLRIAKANGKLEVTLISPRSGEHKARLVTYKAEELIMEFDREIQGNKVTVIYKGKLAGDKLSGTATAKGFEDQYSGKWEASKN